MKKTLIQKILAFSAGHKEADLEAQDENALLAVWMGLVEEKKVADEKKVTDLTAQIATLSAQAKAPDTTGLKGLEDKLLALANQIAAADTEAKLNVLRMSAVSRVEKSTLPDLSKKRLTAVVMGLSAVTEDAVTALIKDETDFITELTKDQHGFSGLGQIEEGLNSKEKLSAAFAAELGVPGADGKIDKQWGMLGIKKFYQQTTGDYDMRQKPNFKRASFAAAQSSDFADMLAPVLYKKLLAEYQEAPYPDGFLVDDVRTATDFKNMRSGTVGGFGVMDVVDEGGTYQPVAIPTDYYSEYAVEKRGALLPITWETIVNDDIGLIRRLVMLFGRAARRTHSQYVFSLMTDNPNTYDIHPLFSAAYHSNYGTGALATGELETIKLAMFKQTEPGSGARLGLVMEHLFIPIDLQVTANNINQREYLDSARVTPNPFWHQFGANNENIHVVPHWTNAKDWYIKGRGKDAPFIEMAYLNGMKEPELLLQDNPIVGSVFTADTFTYKVRHIYNGKCLDWRNVYFEDVT